MRPCVRQLMKSPSVGTQVSHLTCSDKTSHLVKENGPTFRAVFLCDHRIPVFHHGMIQKICPMEFLKTHNCIQNNDDASDDGRSPVSGDFHPSLTVPQIPCAWSLRSKCNTAYEIKYAQDAPQRPSESKWFLSKLYVQPGAWIVQTMGQH